MKAQSICVKLVVAAALILTAPWVWAQDGLEGALPRAGLASPLNLAAPFDQKLAIADFDNDHKPDGAVLVGFRRLAGQNSFRIEVHLSHSNNTDLTFESPETSLAITAWDINKDGAADVVVEQPVTHKRLYVWLGDGHGGFHKGRIEDFPSDGNANGERFDAPSSRSPDCPAVCLAPQRDTETGKLAAQPLPGLPPSWGNFEPFAASSSPTSAAFSLYSSRAPPPVAL